MSRYDPSVVEARMERLRSVWARQMHLARVGRQRGWSTRQEYLQALAYASHARRALERERAEAVEHGYTPKRRRWIHQPLPARTLLP